VLGARGLTKLSVWWLKLGIRPLRTEPASPHQNGAHERFHRTLKAETGRPPAGNRNAQQRRFNRFRAIYNDVRTRRSVKLRRLRDGSLRRARIPRSSPIPSTRTTSRATSSSAQARSTSTESCGS
jgi:transposase InsO family protein